MRKKISYIELGATLFVPASHKDICKIVSGQKYKNLKSLVIDAEDGLDAENLDAADENIKKSLSCISEKSPLLFLRARDTAHLKEILLFKDIDKLTGFVLAKFSLSNADSYLKLLEGTKHLIMPSIETQELFNHEELYRLKAKIEANKERILLVRFGLEDMLRQLGMRRKCEDSIFDFSATSTILGHFIATFKSAGFAVSGGVYPCFKDNDGLRKDVKRDLKEGLFSKTIIHPNQIDITHELYKVTDSEYNDAKEIVASSKVVFNQDGKMAETLTMTPYAKEILLRAEFYGVAKKTSLK